jgi:hypothetical protein
MSLVYSSSTDPSTRGRRPDALEFFYNRGAARRSTNVNIN